MRKNQISHAFLFLQGMRSGIQHLFSGSSADHSHVHVKAKSDLESALAEIVRGEKSGVHIYISEQRGYMVFQLTNSSVEIWNPTGNTNSRPSKRSLQEPRICAGVVKRVKKRKECEDSSRKVHRPMEPEHGMNAEVFSNVSAVQAYIAADKANRHSFLQCNEKEEMHCLV